MAFDPAADYTSAGSGTQFPGTAQNTASTTLGLSKRLAAIPVILKAGKPASIADTTIATLRRFGEPVDPAEVAQPPQLVRFDDALASLDEMTDDELAGVQNQLFAAGLYPKTYYGKNSPGITPGLNDSATLSAYKQALLHAARAQKPINDVINERIAQRAAAGLPTVPTDVPTRAPLVTKLPNPDDLRATFDAAVRTRLGRKDDALVSRMVSSFQQVVAQEQQQTYNASDPTGQGGTVVQAPDPSAFAQQQIRAAAPAEAAAHDAVGVYSDFLDLWGSQRA